MWHKWPGRQAWARALGWDLLTEGACKKVERQLLWKSLGGTLRIAAVRDNENILNSCRNCGNVLQWGVCSWEVVRTYCSVLTPPAEAAKFVHISGSRLSYLARLEKEIANFFTKSTGEKLELTTLTITGRKKILFQSLNPLKKSIKSSISFAVKSTGYKYCSVNMHMSWTGRGYSGIFCLSVTLNLFQSQTEKYWESHISIKDLKAFKEQK